MFNEKFLQKTTNQNIESGTRGIYNAFKLGHAQIYKDDKNDIKGF